MALYIGDTLISGEIEGQKLNLPFSLFEFQFADHILNNASWLRADTFSWASGAVYVSAYEHLVDDIDNITAETETIAGYTVTFYRATDGHKICLADQESTVADIFTATGVAWYYILDTANQRFKLPRTKYGFIGLRDEVGKYVQESLPNIRGSVSLITGANDMFDYGAFYKNTANPAAGIYGNSSGTNSINSFDASRSSSTYQDNAPVQQRATQMYLYFYVGETIQNANILNPIANALDAIPISNISYSASLSLATNTAYTLTLSGDITFILPNPEAGKLNQIEVQIYMATAYTIGLGTSYFFGGGAPDMSEAGYYSIMYEYDWLQQHWVVGALKKGASS